MAKAKTELQKFWAMYERAMKRKRRAVPVLAAGKIRFVTDSACGCPLTFAYDPTEPVAAADARDIIDNDMTDAIINAADKVEGYDSTIRKRLLRIAKLKESR